MTQPTTIREWLAEFPATPKLRWLVAPVRGAESGTLRALEWFRAFCTGSGITALLTTLLWVAAHLDMLHFDAATEAQVVTALGTATFCVHVLIQYFQGNSPCPTPPPPPGPTPPPA